MSSGGEGERKSLAPQPFVRPPEPGFVARWVGRGDRLIEAIGDVAFLSVRSARALFTRPFEGKAIVYQLESLG
ncbi:MAG: hypothetical protein ACHREM_20995, partial [Polyangiales bacterium]